MHYQNVTEVFQQLEQAAVQKKLFARIGNNKITYGQLLEEMNKLHHLLESAGLQPGDRIALSVSDDYYTSLFFLAFLRYGLATIFIDPGIPAQRAVPMLEKAAVKGIVMDASLLGERKIDPDRFPFHLKVQVSQQKKGKLFNRLKKSKKTESEGENHLFPAVLDGLSSHPVSLTEIDAGQLAYVLFTSGTTSDPKGVMITYNNLFAHMHTLSKVYRLDPSSRLLNILMLYHADGINQGPLLAACNQASWIRPFAFDLSRQADLFNSIYKYRISHFVAVPTLLSFMYQFGEGYEESFQTDDFKFIISVAAKLERELWSSFEARFGVKIMNVYGLTETVNGGIFSGIEEGKRKIGTIGIPIDCEAKVIKEDGSEAATGEVGVLWLRGENVFAGYLEAPEATARVMKDGWFNTGDLATKDETGYFQITGRAKHTVSFGGFNLYPEQVTEMINMHPSVLESVSFGLPDPVFGERLVSAVVLKGSATLSALELVDYLRPRLEQVQVPKQIFFLAELPKGLSGKVRIPAVRERVLQQEETSKRPTENYKESVIQAAAKAFQVSPETLKMTDNSNTIEGWDSMAHLLFVTTLEKQYGLRFSTAEIMVMNSLQSAERTLIEKLG